MRRPTQRRVGLLAAAALVGGVVAAVTPVSARASGGAEPSAAPVAQHLYALPGGDHVRVTGSGQSARADFLPAAGHSAAAVTSNVDGRITVVPVAAIGKISSLDAYQVGAASGSADSGLGSGSAASAAGAATPFYPMTALHITAVDHAGKPVPAAEVIVVNTDDPTKANWDGIMNAGDARIEVPAGHYSVAVAAFETDSAGNSTETDLLSVTDVTVPAAGAAVALDARSAQQVAFTTPQASTFSAAVAGWDRGTTGHMDSFDVGALAGTKFYVGGAAKASYGVLNFSMFGRQVAAGSASYVLAFPNYDQVPASQTYVASGLATVDSTYATDEPKQDLTMSDLFDHPGSSVPAFPELPDVTVHAPSKARQYISAVAGVVYDGLMLPVTASGSLDGELERRLVLTSGEHLTLAWRGTVVAPAPSTYDGPCFLCRKGNTLTGVDEMDTDGSGDVGQWSDGPTTITQDGKQIYSGGTEGQLFTLTLPAAKHHYVYSLDTTHDTTASALSTHTQISWGFDSAQVTDSTPVPILYAQPQFVTDGHDSVAVGTGTVDIAFQHQRGVTASAVKSASVSVSYDDGATWKPTTVALGDGHRVAATWTVPSSAKAGYLALKVSAVDAAGSTVDETVHHAALVNAPGGIAVSGSGAGSGSGGAGAGAGARAVCPSPATGHVRCFALAAAGGVKSLAKGALPDGFARADLLSAYKLPATGGSGRTVAIVDAHDDPQAESDLAVYRSTYGLPACTTANGCFKKVNEHGQTSPLPAHDADDDWNPEVSLDLDMVSAVCPACHILLVESDTTDSSSLATAERTATGSGAVAVSNSWGGDESGPDQALNAAFQHAGVAVTVSSGDAGFIQGAWPASLGNVIAVGGTSLSKAASTSRGWSEKAWKGGGSGCSGYVAKPSWQKDTHCPNRTVADVSAVADPDTGVAVYVEGGWGVFGGTSASSPIVASMIALAGNSGSLTSAKYIYSHAAEFFDVTSGSNADWDCGGDYLCTAGTGYDGPTGVGTPNGLKGL